MLTDSASLSSPFSVDRSGNLSPVQDVSQVLTPGVAVHMREGHRATDQPRSSSSLSSI